VPVSNAACVSVSVHEVASLPTVPARPAAFHSAAMPAPDTPADRNVSPPPLSVPENVVVPSVLYPVELVASGKYTEPDGGEPE